MEEYTFLTSLSGNRYFVGGVGGRGVKGKEGGGRGEVKGREWGGKGKGGEKGRREGKGREGKEREGKERGR